MTNNLIFINLSNLPSHATANWSSSERNVVFPSQATENSSIPKIHWSVSVKSILPSFDKFNILPTLRSNKLRNFQERSVEKDPFAIAYESKNVSLDFLNCYINTNDLLSLILVKENVRPACLFQPPSLFQPNNTIEKTKTESIIKQMKTLFPDLIFSENGNYQGIIISKTNYNGRNNITNEEMGKILGYPCYKDFDKINKNIPYYTIEIVALTTKGERITLLTNVSLNKNKLPVFKKIAQMAKEVLDKEIYKNILMYLFPQDEVQNKIESINVIVTKEIPTQSIIHKLTYNKSLIKEEKDKILNILYNLGYSINLTFYFINNFQYNNPTHRGILLTLLLRDINDNLTPFFPLQKYPEQDNEICKINTKFEKELVDVLKKTELVFREPRQNTTIFWSSYTIL